jgi:tetratricopeptide (TPR) repeat protein
VIFRSRLQALLLSISAVAGAQDPALRKGVELFQQARYEEALHLFEQAARAEPNNPVIQNALGLTDTKLKRIEDANHHYETAIQLDPELADPHRNLGINYLDTRQYENAEKHFRMAANLQPRDPFPHYYLTLLYLTTGRDEQAASEAEPAAELLLNDTDAAFKVAEACLRIGRIEQALSVINILEKKGTLSTAQEFDLATLLNSKQLYQESVNRLRRIKDANPGSWVNRYNLAAALLETSQSVEALSILKSLCVEKPQEGPVLNLMGLAYETAGQPDQALEFYRKAAAADPANHDYYLDYARLLADLNRYDESEQFIESSLRQFGSDYALTIRLGVLKMMQGKLEEARQTFQSAIEANPDVPVGYVALAQTYLREHRDDAAAAELAGVREKLAPDAMVEYYYGLALERVQHFEEAIAPLQNAIRLTPDVPEPHYALGKADAALNRPAAARTEFERVIQLDPTHVSAHYQLSRIYAQLGDAAKARTMAELTKQLVQTQREEGLKAQRARLGKLEPLE